MDLDLEDLNLQAEESTELELSEQMEHLAGWTHLRNPESGGQGAW